jgi:hypothetical protein
MESLRIVCYYLNVKQIVYELKMVSDKNNECKPLISLEKIQNKIFYPRA